MKVLHILRSEPDETVEKLSRAVSSENTITVAPLYQGQVNWKALVDEIFTHDKVICWW